MRLRRSRKGFLQNQKAKKEKKQKETKTPQILALAV
jgi:hypothetical protein